MIGPKFSHSLAFLLLTSLAAGEIKNVGWWKNTIFYQIYPRSFMDANGDGIGDLNGITGKLDHIVESGIGAIWISPFYQSPMVDFGYDISDFRAIDPTFGTMADFEALMKRAKELQIKVILDFVPNHSSDKHDWFKRSIRREKPYDEFYIWHDGKGNGTDGKPIPPNNWLSVFSGSAWTYNEQRKQWYLHQFAPEQPDLNYSNLQLQSEMTEVIKFWLKKGIDGFRVDAIPHLFEHSDLPDEPRSNNAGVQPNDYAYLNHIYTKDDPRTYGIFESWRKTMDTYASETNTDEKILMAEAYTDLNNTMKYYDCGAQMPFNFKFIVDLDKNSVAQDYKNAIDAWMDNMPSGAVANWVIGNHDRSRVASRYEGRADQMTMLAMILPGVAVTYNGEEIGMVDTCYTWTETQDPQGCNVGKDRYQEHSRDRCRSPFQWDDTVSAGFSKSSKTWLRVNPGYRELNLKKQKEAGTSHYKVYQALTKLRNDAILKEGSLETIKVNDKVLGVVRQHEGQSVVLLINFEDDKKQVVDLTKYASIEHSQETKVYISSVGSNVTAGEVMRLGSVELPAKASLILVQRSSASATAPFAVLLVLALAKIGLM